MQRLIPNCTFVGCGDGGDECVSPPNADPARNCTVGDHSSSPSKIRNTQPASHDTAAHTGSDDDPDANSASRDSDADADADEHSDADADSDANVDSDANRADRDTDANGISVRRLLLVELHRFCNLHRFRWHAHDHSNK
jgi:hypothetical protein